MHMCFCVLLYFTACMLYYCNTVGWAWWDWGLIWWLTILLQCFDTVGWVTWSVKISSPNDLYCVEWDVKPYSTTTTTCWGGATAPSPNPTSLGTPVLRASLGAWIIPQCLLVVDATGYRDCYSCQHFVVIYCKMCSYQRKSFSTVYTIISSLFVHCRDCYSVVIT